jgi:DNA gyrase subunit A
VVGTDDQVMIVTDTGRMIRIHASEVRLVMGRATRGVRLMRLDDGETIVDFERLAEAEPTLDAEVDPEVDADVDVNGPDDAS